MGDQKCPTRCKKCDDGNMDCDLDGLTRYCNTGEDERTPKSCGTTKPESECAAFLDTFTDDLLVLLVASLQTCDETNSPFPGISAYGNLAVMKTALEGLARECGYEIPASSTSEAP